MLLFDMASCILTYSDFWLETLQGWYWKKCKVGKQWKAKKLEFISASKPWYAQSSSTLKAPTIVT